MPGKTVKKAISRFITTLLILTMLALFAGIAYGANCGGDIPCNCSDTLTASRTLNSSDNLTGCSSSDGLVLGSTADLVLDCAGYTISGDGTNDGIPTGSSHRAVIKNCIITGFSNGIYVSSSTNVTILNNTIYNISNYGLYSDAAGGWINITGNTIYYLPNTYSTGIYLVFSEIDDIIQDNVIYDVPNSDCIYFYFGQNITFSNNTIHNCSRGIFLQAITNLNVTQNTIYDCTDTGLHLDTSITNANVWHNNIYNNNLNVNSTSAIELSFSNEGNYWGRSTCPLFTAGTDSNAANVVDTYPYSSANAWLSAGTPVNCSACGTTITGSLTLANDITGCSGHGLEITGNDVVLDCAGHLLNGTSQAGSYGVYINNADNVTVRNCNISYFSNGIYATSSDYATIEDNNITNNTGTGASFSGSSHGTISGGDISSNNQIQVTTAGGIGLTSSSNNNTITGIYMHNNKYSAIYITSSNDVTIDSNNIDENCGGNTGVGFSSANNFQLTGNNITRGTGWGVSIATSTGQITNNNISNNTYAGIVTYSNVVMNVSQNTITYNENYGIGISSTTTALVWHNNIFGNDWSGSNEQVSSSSAIELSYNNEGNYWGRSTCPLFIAGTDTNRDDVVDSYPYKIMDDWIGSGPYDCNPNITLSSPANDSSTTNSYPGFLFTAVSKANTTFPCKLVFDNWVSETNSTTENNTATAFNMTDPVDEEGGTSHTWYINCTDDVSTVQSEIRTLNVDSTPPTVTLSSPANNTNTNSKNVTYTPTDANLNTCRWYTINASDPADTSSGAASANNNTLNNQQMTLVDGSFHWYINCTDTFGNTGLSEQRTINYDGTDPAISSVANSSISSSGATITWTTNENTNSQVDYGTNASVLGSTSSSATYTTSNSIGLSGLSASTEYYYNVTSCDQAGNCKTEGPYSFNTSAATTGGGGGGGGRSGPTSTSYTIGDLTSGSGEWTLGRGDGVNFGHKKQQHTITVKTVGRNYAVFGVSSTPQEVTLHIGESAEVDLDDDGTKDISMRLMDIFYNKVLLNVKSLVSTRPDIVLLPPRAPKPRAVEEPAAAEGTEQGITETTAAEKEGQDKIIESKPTAGPSEEEKDTSGKSSITGILIVFVLLALVIGMIVKIVRKNQKR